MSTAGETVFAASLQRDPVRQLERSARFPHQACEFYTSVQRMTHSVQRAERQEHICALFLSEICASVHPPRHQTSAA
jgi:hypothetical protein